MSTASFLKKPIYSALVFFGTLLVLSIGYAALSGGLSTSDLVSTGSGLTSTSWNRLVNGVLELDTRTAPISSSTGNIGIGTASPGQKLDVAGTMRANSYKMKTYSIGGPTAGLFSFSSANVYADTDLTLSVILTSQATVTCNYNITMASGGIGNHLVTRLVFSGITKTRAITGDTNYWSNVESYTETMPAGTYVVKVQYRTPDGGSNNPSTDDWQNRLLQCYVYGDQ